MFSMVPTWINGVESRTRNVMGMPRRMPLLFAHGRGSPKWSVVRPSIIGGYRRRRRGQARFGGDLLFNVVARARSKLEPHEFFSVVVDAPVRN